MVASQCADSAPLGRNVAALFASTIVPQAFGARSPGSQRAATPDRSPTKANGETYRQLSSRLARRQTQDLQCSHPRGALEKARPLAYSPFTPSPLNPLPPPRPTPFPFIHSVPFLSMAHPPPPALAERKITSPPSIPARTVRPKQSFPCHFPPLQPTHRPG